MTVLPSSALPEIARLVIEIDDVTPQVTRCVEVPLDIRLDDLHFVLQIAVGWQNGHPFEFRIGDAIWGLHDRDAENSPTPADQATLANILALGAEFKYDYVFGEDWQHTVTLQARSAAAPGTRYPHLVSAAGRCPPADIGGPLGYETYLRAIADPASIHHDDMVEFDAPDFDPNAVDTAILRKNLADLSRYIGRKPSAPATRRPAAPAKKEPSQAHSDRNLG